MRHIVKVEQKNGSFRIVIPRSLIQEKRWHNVRYVFVEPDITDSFTLRRFIDEEKNRPEG